jgi:hypothetical protein
MEFAVIWSVCAKKVGKAKAKKAYLRLRKAGQLPDATVIRDSLQRLQLTEQWTKQGRQYQPHLEAWLNRGGWDDEIPKTNGGGKAQSNLAGLDADRIAKYSTGGTVIDNSELE